MSILLINWNLLVEKFGMNKATIKFEELALMTQRTRDGNKDIHLEEYEKNIPINSLDKWAEVKYKQKNTALTKKDMDLTILSGLINGNIELIMFISNGYIPKSLIERSLSAVQLQNIRLSYILGDQLENWLINHPEIYKCIFEEDINPNLKTKNIIEIKNIQLRYFSTNSQYNVNIMTKFNIGERYIIDFFIYSTFETYGKIIDNEYPFLFLVTDNFNKFDRFKISIGLNRISFIVMANNSFKGTIQYKILIDKKEYTYNTKRLFITQNKIIKLAYPQQLDFIEKIYNLITFHESVDSQQIIPIYGKTGMGKTTLLKKTYEQVCTNNDVIYIDFSSPNQYDENHSINYSLLCKLACFISLGNISYHINNSTSEAATYIKEELNRLGFSPIYSELIDGCFNTIMSKRVIKLFVDNIIENGISESRFFYKMIFIIDNIHCLTETETKIFFKLLSFDKKVNNNNIFIICATDGKFEYDYPKEKFLSLPNIFELTGLQPHNIITSIKENTICYPKVEDIFVCHEFLKNPLFLKEYIYQMQIVRNDIELNKLVYYNYPLYSTESIMRFEGYNYLLDIIFSLNNGIKKSYLVDYYVKTNKKSKKMINKDINFLRKNHIISIENNIIFSYHDYIRNLYIKTKNKNIYKKSYSDFYKYVYQFCSQDKLLNDYEILSLIFLTNKKQYTFYKNELIRIFKYYINKTQYGAAYEIGNILYNHIINKRKKTQEECNILYLYTDCMNHCSSSKDDVMNTLKEIRSKSSNNLLLKIEIQASMHNEKFWKLDIDNSIFNDSHNLEIEINNFLRINKRKDIEKRLKRALYTCINRWMVSLLLIDNYSSSLEMLDKGLEYLHIIWIMLGEYLITIVKRLLIT